MKVTKRKTGYTLRLNDGEYTMLEALVGHAATQAKSLLSGNAKSAFTRRTKATNGDLLRVDSDLSTKPSTQVPPANGFSRTA